MPASERDRAALAWVCERHEQIRQLGELGGVRSRLESALEALRQPDADIPGLLACVESLLRHCGWGGSLRGEAAAPPWTGPAVSGVPSLGSGAGQPLVEAYVCPSARCPRIVFPADVREPPVCSFTGALLPLRQYGDGKPQRRGAP